MNPLVLSLTPSISSNQPFFNKGFVVEEGGESLKSERKQTGGGESQTYLYAHSVKICLIFQTENKFPSNRFLGSC